MTTAARLLVQQLAQRGEFMHDPRTTIRLVAELVCEVSPDIVGEWAAKAVEDAIDQLGDRGE